MNIAIYTNSKEPQTQPVLRYTVGKEVVLIDPYTSAAEGKVKHIIGKIIEATNQISCIVDWGDGDKQIVFRSVSTLMEVVT